MAPSQALWSDSRSTSNGDVEAPVLDKKDVIEALYLIFGQDQKGINTERPRHFHRGKGGKNRGYYVDEETGYYYDDEDDGSYELDDETGYYEGPDWNPEQPRR